MYIYIVYVVCTLCVCNCAGCKLRCTDARPALARRLLAGLVACASRKRKGVYGVMHETKRRFKQQHTKRTADVLRALCRMYRIYVCIYYGYNTWLERARAMGIYPLWGPTFQAFEEEVAASFSLTLAYENYILCIFVYPFA